LGLFVIGVGSVVGCAPAKPAEVILARWKAIPWSAPNPEVVKEIDANQRRADSMNGHFTISKYEGGDLCMIAEQPTVSKQLAETNKNVFRIAATPSIDALKEEDPPKVAAKSVTVQKTFASVLGEGTVSEVCFGGVVQPTTRFLHVEVGPTTDGKKSRIFWELTNPNDPTTPEQPAPGRVNRTRKF
jgi:hypothetical protein